MRHSHLTTHLTTTARVSRSRAVVLTLSITALAALALGCGSASGDGPAATGTDTGGSGGDTAAAGDTSVDDSTAPPGDTSVAETSGDAPKGDAPADADPFGPYPSGPYGNTEGAVLANLTWDGYIDEKADAVATTKPFVTGTSLDKLRRLPSKGFGLIHVAEFF